MKEAIGGTWIFGIVLTFLVLFTTFISVSTNYSRCFRIKDEILLAIEHYKGVNEKSIGEINSYLTNLGYTSTGRCDEGYGNETSLRTSKVTSWFGFNTNNSSNAVRNSGNANYCIRKYVVTETGYGPIGHPRSAYYQVIVFFKLDWPILSQVFNIRINGETSIIHNFNDMNTFTDNNIGG